LRAVRVLVRAPRELLRAPRALVRALRVPAGLVLRLATPAAVLEAPEAREVQVVAARGRSPM
jgi:hypothetical protein